MSLRFHADIDLPGLVTGDAFQVDGGKPMVTLDTPQGSWFSAAGPEGVAELTGLIAKLTVARDRLDEFITAAGGAL